MNNRTILENTALKAEVESLTSQLKAVHQQLASCEGERARVWTVGDEKPEVLREAAIKGAQLHKENPDVGYTEDEKIVAVDGYITGYEDASAHDAQRIAELEAEVERLKMQSSSPLTIPKLISFLSRTKPEDWCTKICRTKNQKQNCLLGHVFNWGGNIGIDWLESNVATTFMFYPVNDGEHPNYPQETAKDRCIAYLTDIENGVVKSSAQLMDEM